jgi:succinate dehydrogenase / fumarate reductase flavoprotein subunit
MLYDAIIVGSGGAALSLAIHLKQKNKNIILLSKSNITSAQTVQAQGGINAALNRSDSIQTHIKDTIKSSHGLYDKNMIEYMCKEAPSIISWLDSLGVPFNRDNTDNIDQRRLGGSSFNRANYSSDYTGLKILHTLYDKAISLGIEFIEDAFLLNLIKEDEYICGITYLNLKNSSVNQILASNTILATGGYGNIYYNYTTNSSDSTSDGQMAAFRAGAILENMEMVQFHPTALKHKYILISESARGEGGYLVTKDGQRFVDELLPRDIVAREIYKKLNNNENVFLDLRHLGKDKILHLIPQEYKLCYDHLGLKMDKDLIPITPASHYSMGGIKVDNTLKTSLNNLYAIGEVSSAGVHGANRLGGNSLLEITVFAKKLANSIDYEFTPIQKQYNQVLEDKNKIERLLNQEGKPFHTERKNLGEIMFSCVGLFRDEKGLQKGLSYVDKLINTLDSFSIEDKSKIFNMQLKNYLEFENSIQCAKLIIDSALVRKESRGAHFRIDFQFEDSKVYNTNVKLDQKVRYVEINNN